MNIPEKYLDEWTHKTCQAIFESNMARWIDNEITDYGLPDNWGEYQ
jgi:hypothetical protein